MSLGEGVKIKNLLARVRESTWDEEITVYDVEPEVIGWAHLHMYMYLKRYKEGKGKHWTEDEERKTFIGLMGQKIFDIMLQQLAVPKDHNDPVIDWRLEKDYDFKIPELGTVEVKCFDHWCRKVLIKLEEWHGNDFCVIFKFGDEHPSEVHMMGWLTKEQVENLRISKKGEHYTPIADAYITDFDRLNPSNKFIKMLEGRSLCESKT